MVAQVSKRGSEIAFLAWHFFRPRNLVLMLRAFAYVLAVRVVLDLRNYWGEPGYVEVDGVYLRDAAGAALIVGAFAAFAYWREAWREAREGE